MRLAAPRFGLLALAWLLALPPAARAAQDPPDDPEMEELGPEEGEEPPDNQPEFDRDKSASTVEELDDLLDIDPEQAKSPDDEGGLPEATARLRALTALHGEAAPDLDYREFLTEAAAKESDAWADLLGWGAKAPGEPTWVSLGPTRANKGQGVQATDAGEVLAVVPHPKDAGTLWIATAGGGVWKTTDGATWVPQTDAQGSLSTGGLALDPQDPEHLYLGLGDPYSGTFSGGIGLVQSKDGGATWGEPTPLGDSRFTRQVFATKDAVLVATETGVFRSLDRGATWARVLEAPGHPVLPFGGAWSLAAAGGKRFLASTQVIARSGITAHLHASADGGATWSEVALPGGPYMRVALASAPSEPGTIFALASFPRGAGDVLRSADGGATWTSIGVARGRLANTAATETMAKYLGGQPWYDLMITVHPEDPKTIFFGMQMGVVRAREREGAWTFEATSHWTGQGRPYVHADIHTAAWVGSGTLLVGTDGGVFRTADGATTWSDALNVGVTSHRFYSIGASATEQPFVVGGLQDAGSRARVGETSTFDLVGHGDGFEVAVHPKRAGTYLVTAQHGQVLQPVKMEMYTDGLGEYNPEETPFYTRLRAWTGSPTGDDLFTHRNLAVFRSRDFGRTWKALGTTGLPQSQEVPLSNVAVAPKSDQVLAVVSNRKQVFTSTDGGANWTAAGAPEGAAGELEDLIFAADPNVLYLTSQMPKREAKHLWRSADGGRTWKAIDGGSGFPAGVPVNSITVDPRDDKTLYAGTHFGLYRSTDEGASWARYGAGLPLVSVTDLYVSPDGSVVRASTYGRGIWEMRPAAGKGQDADEERNEEAMEEDEESGRE